MEKYIQKGIFGVFEPSENQDPASLETGTTWQDYQAGKWIRLSQAQAAFHEEHPEAAAKEIIEMQLAPPPVRTPEQAKAEKLSAIDRYDSEEVNRFYVSLGGQQIGLWFDAPQRSTYQTSITARRKLIAAGKPIVATIHMT